MKTLTVHDDILKEWKIFCSKKGVSMIDATEMALSLAMKKDILKFGGTKKWQK